MLKNNPTNAINHIDNIINYLYKPNKKNSITLTNQIFNEMFDDEDVLFKRHILLITNIYNFSRQFGISLNKDKLNPHKEWEDLPDEIFDKYKTRIENYFEVEKEKELINNFLNRLFRKHGSTQSLAYLLPKVIYELMNLKSFDYSNPISDKAIQFKEKNQEYLDIIRKRLTLNLLG